MLARFIGGFALAAALGCSAVDEVQDGGGGGNQGPRARCDDSAAAECRVFDLVNEERTMRDLPPYGWSSTLARAAALHAEDMVDNDYFSHESPDGRDFSDRAVDAGYEGFPSGENIAAGQRTPEAVMESWMNSEGHRSNLLSRSSSELGVGLHELHWVQVFGQR